MARKSLNFINSLRDVFRRKHSNVKPQIEVQKAKKNFEHKPRKKRTGTGFDSDRQYHGKKQRGNFLVGGCNDRDTKAIYHKPPRGKFKGYMREL